MQDNAHPGARPEAAARARGALPEGLLIDRMYDKKGYAEALADAGVRLDQPYFRVAILSLSCDKDEPAHDPEPLECLAAEAIPSARTYVFFYDTNLVMLFNSEGGGQAFAETLAGELRDFIALARQRMKAECTVCLGCEVFGIREIPCSYRSAMAAWERTLEYDTADQLIVNEYDLARSDNMAYLDELQLMINYLLAGKYINAVRVQARVFEHHARNKKPYLTVINDRMTFFRSTFLHAVEAAITGDPEAIEAYLQRRNLLNVPDPDKLTLDELWDIYFSIAGIAEAAQEKRRTRAKDAACRIRDHIDAHYREMDLDTTRLAEAMGISTSYLHRLFKSAFGQTVLAYITDCRIKEAKRLLRETKARTKDIAAMVGYNSPASFYRAFQKSCAVSPDTYRKSEK